MTSQDPLDALRDEDPINEDTALTPSLHRIRASVVSATTSDGRDRLAARPARLRWALTLAGLVAVAGVLAAVALNGLARPTPIAQPSSAPIVAASPTRPASGGDLTSCAYNPTSSLMERDYVFDGTVLRVVGNQVEFKVNEWFRGPGGASVTMTLTPGYGGSALMDEGSPMVRPGERWLVAGDGGFIWGCGFTHRYATP